MLLPHVIINVREEVEGVSVPAGLVSVDSLKVVGQSAILGSDTQGSAVLVDVRDELVHVLVLHQSVLEVKVAAKGDDYIGRLEVSSSFLGHFGEFESTSGHTMSTIPFREFLFTLTCDER